MSSDSRLLTSLLSLTEKEAFKKTLPLPASCLDDDDDDDDGVVAVVVQYAILHYTLSPLYLKEGDGCLSVCLSVCLKCLLSVSFSFHFVVFLWWLLHSALSHHHRLAIR